MELNDGGIPGEGICMNISNFNRINIAAPDLMVICFDNRDGQMGTGRMYHYYNREEVPFLNEYHLLNLMEDVMESINYPQASTAMRNYREKESVNTQAGKEKPEKIVGKEELLAHRGKLSTFVVYIQYRQNATWQGDIIWVEGNVIRSFRSALEMLKLMDNV